MRLATYCGSFAAEAFGGVGQGGAEGLVTDGGEGDQEDAGAGGGEDPPGHVGAVGVLMQEFFHAPGGEGDGDEEGQRD